jgi:hypothetical protein
MKLHVAITVSMAAVSLVLLVPKLAAAKSTTSAQQSQNNSAQSTYATHEAAEMVPAQAALEETLDSRNASPGQPVRAILADTVHLKDGTELRSGTVLEGKISTDDMQENGTSKLALCLDQAHLKDGKTIPIKATIVGIYGPGSGIGVGEGYPITPGDQVANDWSRTVQGVDQIGAISGADLHSRISSQNSGVLVSTKKDDIKIKSGTEFALAIAAQKPGQQSTTAGTNR